MVVSSPIVKAPAAVRYGWAHNPDCHLYNTEDLPASPSVLTTGRTPKRRRPLPLRANPQVDTNNSSLEGLYDSKTRFQVVCVKFCNLVMASVGGVLLLPRSGGVAVAQRQQQNFAVNSCGHWDLV